jgi:hypothetical protein
MPATIISTTRARATVRSNVDWRVGAVAPVGSGSRRLASCRGRREIVPGLRAIVSKRRSSANGDGCDFLEHSNLHGSGERRAAHRGDDRRAGARTGGASSGKRQRVHLSAGPDQSSDVHRKLSRPRSIAGRAAAAEPSDGDAARDAARRADPNAAAGAAAETRASVGRSRSMPARTRRSDSRRRRK